MKPKQEELQNLQNRPPSIGQNLLISTSVSFTVKTAFAPIERFKLMYQAQGELLKSGKIKTPFNGYCDMIRRTIKKEGFLSLWKGNGTYLLRYTINSGIGLMVKDQIFAYDPIGRLNSTTENNLGKVTLSKKVLYGGIGGLVGMTFAYPFEYARTRLANDIAAKGTKKQFSSPYDAIKQAYQISGIKGVYRGFSVTIPTIFLYRGLEYGLYDYFCQNAKPEENAWASSWMGKFITAYIISNSLTMLLYPMNTLRVRYLMSLEACENRRYSNVFAALKDIHRKEGSLVFMKGSLANLFKNIGTSAVLVLYDKFSERVRSQGLQSSCAI